jgi:hypothetical protein
MKKPLAFALFLSASVLCAAGFGALPDRKQKTPGACAAKASSTGAAAGIAISEEGGPHQHAGTLHGKPSRKATAPGGGDCVAPGQGKKAGSRSRR